MKRAVIAIGGNALSTSAGQQERQLVKAARSLLPVLTSGHEIVLVHGNGPQVGKIHDSFELAASKDRSLALPFYDCTALNEGDIGYHFEQALRSVLDGTEERDVPIATVLTRVVVDACDPAFEHPDKPVGTYYSEEDAKKLMAETGIIYGQDSGRGWRRMVPSPAGKHIVEAESIKRLVESGCIVIAGGGAGVPVVPTAAGGYEPIEAVCDKDLTSAMLAGLIEADLLMILTAVDAVSINFGTPLQRSLKRMTPDEAEQYIGQGQFQPGSMLPKVRACVEFARSSAGNRAVIGNLQQAAKVLAGEAGTVIE